MYYLALDTSSSFGIVALFKQDRLICSRTIPSTSLSSSFLKEIELVLKTHSVDFQDLSFIAVGIGPGSFTGTRIGIVTTKALCYPSALPIVPFYSLLLAMPKEPPACFTLIADAKSHLFYTLEMTKKNEQVIFSIPDLKKENELQSNHFFFTLDPSLNLSFSVQKVPLNLDFLSDYIQNQFKNRSWIDSFELKPLYLKNP